MVRRVTVIEMRSCMNCNGTGHVSEGNSCANCGGSGIIEVQTIR